jgi:hypothetical protein
MNTKQIKTKQQLFTSKEVLQAPYLAMPASRTQTFKTNPRAYKVNPDGSISSAWELNYFN